VTINFIEKVVRIDDRYHGTIGVVMYQKALMNDHPYHLVISDLTIPRGMGGREAVQKILEIDSNAKVIATSGYAMDPIMEHFEEYGFIGRIPKPFKLEDVRREITRVYNCS
jgi:CheY-like chemotaxis protein